MADGVGELREPTPQEKKNMVVLNDPALNRKSPEMRARIIFERHQAELYKQRIPFCTGCANRDYKELIDKQIAELTDRRETKTLKNKEINVDITENFLKEYEGNRHFEFLKDRPIYAPIVIDGVKTNRLSEMSVDYRCKDRGYGASLMIPIIEYNERKKK